MPVAAPSDGYLKMISYGRHKTHLRWDQLYLQSVAAGFWAAVYGHCCLSFASCFYSTTNEFTNGLTKLAYGTLFPGCFIAIVYTGSELFTGNTVTMIMLLFNDGKKVFVPLIRIWILSITGNLAGATFGGFLISWCSGVFHGNSRAQKFLFYMARKKIRNGFVQNLALGIGCNLLVCLATWCYVVTDDGAGKILAFFYTIGVFIMGGFEHIVVNFYILSTAHMVGFKDNHFGVSVWRNWVPVGIGNILAGTIFTGCIWWYALHPKYSSDLVQTKNSNNQDLVNELSRRKVGGEPEDDSTPRWEPSRKFSLSMRPYTDYSLPVCPPPPPPPTDAAAAAAAAAAASKVSPTSASTSRSDDLTSEV